MRKSMPEDAALARSLREVMDERMPDDARHPSEGRIAAYLAHELDDAETERMEAHLAACARCADELVTVMAVEDDAQLAASFAPDVRAAAEAATAAVASSKGRSSRPPASSTPPVWFKKPSSRRFLTPPPGW